MADVFFFLPFEGVEPICLQLFRHATRQLEARREAHQLGFNQQCVLCVQRAEQPPAPRGVHVPPQFFLGVFDLGVQFWMRLTVETLFQGFHVVIHCGTSFWQPQHISQLLAESYYFFEKGLIDSSDAKCDM